MSEPRTTAGIAGQTETEAADRTNPAPGLGANGPHGIGDRGGASVPGRGPGEAGPGPAGAAATTRTAAVIPPEVTRPPVVRVLMALRVWLILLLGVGVWAAVTAVADVPKYIFPSPRAVVREFAKRSDLYLEAFWVSLLESVAGFVAAAVLGVLLAVLIARSRLMETMLYPYLNIIRVTPTVAVAPLLTIWFGTGTLSVVVVSFLLAFFPVIVQTVLGLNSADPGLVDVMRVCNASELSILRKVRLPTALPYVFSSFRISAPAAVIGVLAGEFMSGEKGLGYLITVMSAQLNTPAVFALIILSSILGIGLFEVCVLVEKRLVTWHPSVRL